MSNVKTSDAEVRRKQSIMILNLAPFHVAILIFFFVPFNFVAKSDLAREHFGSWPQWIFWGLFAAYVVAVFLYLRHFVFKNNAS